jgi:hypothetical protein
LAHFSPFLSLSNFSLPHPLQSISSTLYYSFWCVWVGCESNEGMTLRNLERKFWYCGNWCVMRIENEMKNMGHTVNKMMAEWIQLFLIL